MNGVRTLLRYLAATAVTALAFGTLLAFGDDSANTWPSATSGQTVYWTDRATGDVSGLPADMAPGVDEVDGYTSTTCDGGWEVPAYQPVLKGGLALHHYEAFIHLGFWYQVPNLELAPGDCLSSGFTTYPVRLTGVYQYQVRYQASNGVTGLPTDATELITWADDHWEAADYTIPLDIPANSSGAEFDHWDVYLGDTPFGTANPGEPLPFSEALDAGGDWRLAAAWSGDAGDPGDDPADPDNPNDPGEDDNPGGSDGALRLKKYAVVKKPGATCDFPPASMFDLLAKDRTAYSNADRIRFDSDCVTEIAKGSSIPDSTEITWVYRVFNDGDEAFYPEQEPGITIHDDHEGDCVIETYPTQMPGHTWDLCGITGEPTMSPLGVEATFPPPSRYYDGTTHADLPNLRLIGVDDGDDVTLDTSNTVCEYDGKDASTSRIVTCRNFALAGDDADKYKLPSGYVVTVHNASIIPKPVTYRLDIVKYDDGRDWVTPSTWDAEFNAAWDGLVGQETLTATPVGKFTFDNLELGTDHEVVGHVGLAGGTGKLSNYDVSVVKAGELRYSSIIDLQVTVTSSNQVIALNRYFDTDNVIVQWNDTGVEGSNDELGLAAAKTHTFTQPGSYTVRLVSRLHTAPYLPSPTGCATPLVPKAGTTASQVRVTRFPPLTDFVSTSNAFLYQSASGNMMCGFNNGGAILDFSAGTLDTHWIVTAGGNFFQNFNKDGSLTSLPAGSLDTSRIEGTVGANFFSSFNENGSLTQLPAGALKTSRITAVNGNGMFFAYFNRNGKLTSLPEGSMVLNGISNFRQGAFFGFNNNGALTSLPDGSFNMTNATAASGNMFCYEFNRGGKLTALPAGSFDISNMTSFGNGFFGHFNSWGELVSLPAGSFRLSAAVTSVGTGFFSNFNNTGKLTSLPANSFNTGNIATADFDFFRQFNENGALSQLPAGSFNTSKLSSVTNWVFAEFNDGGKLTNLPAGSFAFGSLTGVGTHFLWGFNMDGYLASIPAGSFNLSSVSSAGNHFISFFNARGRLTNANSFRFPAFNAADIGAESFENSFMSTYTLTSPTAMSTIVNGCAEPSTRRGTFSSNQPGQSSLATNWK
ncbi:MAG: YDG domain-containing protein [Propionibacteriaceae bacterium]|nr:YDG domain-containing protein [Propionibacteriaceae bacterium]